MTVELTLRGDPLAASPPRITDTLPARRDNNREDLLPALDRLYALWSIDRSGYENQQRYIASQPLRAQIPMSDTRRSPPWSLTPTFNAVQKNAESTLSREVINHFLGGLSVADGVGTGLKNEVDDVVQLQDRLNFLLPYAEYATERRAARSIVSASVPDSSLPGTLAAIVKLKQGLASAMAGWLPVRAAEREFGADRFAGQTTSVALTVKSFVARGGVAVRREVNPPETDQTVEVSVFLPSKLSGETNNVFLFFSAGGATEDSLQPGGNSTNVHAIRSGADPTSWIVIGIPGADPGWNTIDTAAIEACLERAGRGRRIDRLRICAHSRGIRGMQQTIRNRHVSLSLVDRIVILDQPDASALTEPPNVRSTVFPEGERRPPVVSYAKAFADANRWSPPTPTTFNAEALLALSFARLIQDRPDVPVPPETEALVRPRIIPSLRPLGMFTTRSGPAVGAMTSVHQWTRDHAREVREIARVDRAAEAEWNRFTRQRVRPLNRSIVNPSPYFHVHTQNLWRFWQGPLVDARRELTRFFDPDTDFGLEIYAHHLFVAEFAHELFD